MAKKYKNGLIAGSKIKNPELTGTQEYDSALGPYARADYIIESEKERSALKARAETIEEYSADHDRAIRSEERVKVEEEYRPYRDKSIRYEERLSTGKQVNIVISIIQTIVIIGGGILLLVDDDISKIIGFLLMVIISIVTIVYYSTKKTDVS